MERLIKYIVAIVFLYAGTMLLLRGLHRLTKIRNKISTIKIEPYYPRHKDSIHYVVSFRVESIAERLAIYIGDQNQVARSKLISLLDTNRIYTLFVDMTEPSYNGMIVAVRKVILNDKTIYKGSRLLTLAGGFLSLSIGVFMLFYIRRNRANGTSYP